jgi:hypothetical protein
MPLAPGIASDHAAAALRPTAAESGTDNRAVQQFQQVLQQQAASPAATVTQPQTYTAAQHAQSQQRPASRNAAQQSGSSEINFSQLADSQSAETPHQQPSALNYGASGAPNPVRDLDQAGKIFSLSV